MITLGQPGAKGPSSPPGKRPSAVRRGFTLIEILIVLAIIMILLTLLAPVLRKARMEFRTAQCNSNLSNLYKALKAYEQDFRLLPPQVLDYSARNMNPGRYWLMGTTDTATIYSGGTAWNNGPLEPATGLPMADPRSGLLAKYYQNEVSILFCALDATNGNGKFSYAMPAIIGLKSTGKVRAPADAVMMMQINPSPTLRGALNGTGSFGGTDRPDEQHDRFTPTLYFDGRAKLEDWRAYEGWKDGPGTFTVRTGANATIPSASEIGIAEMNSKSNGSWGYCVVGSLPPD
jgi:prepilin-type N-terminal cleavage/methylation domain-containing protein